MPNATGGVTPRNQQTIGSSVNLSGFGLFSGQDADVEFLPAAENSGIVFERIDLSPPVRIPATIDYVIPQPRHTVLGTSSGTVETTEHLLAALAGLRIDNCLIRINGPEVPTFDGSGSEFVRALEVAGIARQSALRPFLVVEETVLVTDGPHVGIAVQPPAADEYTIGYILDYGRGPVPSQALRVDVTPETFKASVSFARTFALESEVRQLQSLGFGLRATPHDVVVFGDEGIIDNCLRSPDECVRHKILDCIGDFALAGCDLHGRFTAKKSGHRLNHEMVRKLKEAAKSWNSTPQAERFSGGSGPTASHRPADGSRSLVRQSPDYATPRRSAG